MVTGQQQATRARCDAVYPRRQMRPCAAGGLMGETTTVAARVLLAGAAAGAILAGQDVLAQDTARDRVATALFAALDANGDGTLTRDEAGASADRWFADWKPADASGLSMQTIVASLSHVLPGDPCGGRSATPRVACEADVTAMAAAVPATAPARPAAPRKVLVLARAAGYVHSSIPLAARTVEELGRRTGAWSTTISWDAADITDQNLAQYDAIFLASTTGHFLDDPKDAAATAARRAALLAFVRGGKGLAAIHAATDSYHASAAELKNGQGGGFAAMLASLGPGLGPAQSVGTRLLADGDANGDKVLSRDELHAVAGAWFDRIAGGTPPAGASPSTAQGAVTRAAFVTGYAAIVPPPPPRAPRVGNGQPAATDLGPDDQVGTWPEFNTLLGGFFKFHWNDGQPITYRIDRPDSPLTAAFKGHTPFVVADETYTFGRAVYSRQNVQVLTSVDYAAMSAEDRAKEQFPRDDHDHPLSWIRREQRGRVFYMSHGHNEKVYANPVLLQHLLAGIQYALGDVQ